MYGFLKLNDPKEEKKKTLVLKVCTFQSLITHLYYNGYYLKIKSLNNHYWYDGMFFLIFHFLISEIIIHIILILVTLFKNNYL